MKRMVGRTEAAGFGTGASAARLGAAGSGFAGPRGRCSCCRVRIPGSQDGGAAGGGCRSTPAPPSETRECGSRRGKQRAASRGSAAAKDSAPG